MQPKLCLSLFGTCVVRLDTEPLVEIRGLKHRALFALLATAPMGLRSRKTLQKTLWGEADYDTGNQNLRRALSDLRKTLGTAFDSLLHVTTADIQLDLDRVQFENGDPSCVFLEDLDVREPAFLAWRDQMRAAPEQLAAMCRASRGGVDRIRPWISALPLSVPDGSPERRVLADWVAQELCRSLSRSSLLTVISHLSGRLVDNRTIDIRNVRNTLGVDFLLTGSLRRSGADEICAFDFIDVESGTILWNQDVHCPGSTLTETLPDRLTSVVRAIGRSIAESTLRSVRGLALTAVADHKLLMAGVAAMHRRAIRDFVMSRQYLSEILARTPATAEVHAWLAKWYILSIIKGYSTSRGDDTARALDCTARALDLSPESSFCLTMDGFVHGNIIGDSAFAEQRYSTALEINPNESLAWLLRGSLRAFQDDGLAAVNATETARRLSPIDPFGYYYDSLASSANVAAGNYAKAIEYADRSLAINDRHISTLRSKLTAQHCLGDGAGARATGDVLRRTFPEFRIEEYQRNHPSAVNRIGRLVIEAMKAAGVQ